MITLFSFPVLNISLRHKLEGLTYVCSTYLHTLYSQILNFHAKTHTFHVFRCTFHAQMVLFWFEMLAVTLNFVGEMQVFQSEYFQHGTLQAPRVRGM